MTNKQGGQNKRGVWEIFVKFNKRRGGGGGGVQNKWEGVGILKNLLITVMNEKKDKNVSY